MKTRHNFTAIAFLLVMLGVLALGVNAAAPIWRNLHSNQYQGIDDYLQPGKWLVVMIWAHDCEICKQEIGDYQRFHQRHKAGDITMLGVSMDGESHQEQALEFVAQHGVEFENLIAEPEAVAGFYQILTGSRWVGTPSFLIFGPDSKLKAKQAGAVEVEIVEKFIADNR